jgi:hypothetical protein
MSQALSLSSDVCSAAGDPGLTVMDMVKNPSGISLVTRGKQSQDLEIPNFDPNLMFPLFVPRRAPISENFPDLVDRNFFWGDLVQNRYLHCYSRTNP